MDANASKMRPKPIETRGTGPFLLDFIGGCGFHGKYFAGSSPVSCSRKTKRRTSKRMSFFFVSEPRPGLEDSRSSLSFRSSQSKRPPDVLRRLVLSKTLSGGCGYFLGRKRLISGWIPSIH